MKRIMLCVCSALLLYSCGSKSPSEPSKPTNLTIVGTPDFLLTGQSVSLTANATTNGVASPVTATWSSDSSAASIDASGRLTGVRHGTSTITASYQGTVARFTANVIQNYGGNWAGDYNINRCDASGTFRLATFCDVFNVGKTLPINFSLVQNRESVSGQLAKGAIAGTISGAVGGGGNLNGSGQASSFSGNTRFVYDIGGFNASVDGTRLQANWSENITASGWIGNGYLEISTRIVSKTSGTPMKLSTQQLIFNSPQEMWRAMSVR